MIGKKTTLCFEECLASVEIEYTEHSDSVVFTVNGHDVDVEKSTENNEVFKIVETTEIYLGFDEVKELIRSLQGMLPEGDKK